MKSDVDFTLGFSRSMVATGTPVFAEMTANVSPARTVQNRGPDVVFVVLVVVVARGRVVVASLAVVVRTAAVVVVGPERRPERISSTAMVAASRNAAGAAKRRQGRRGIYQPEAAQISRLRRAASAPAASR